MCPTLCPSRDNVSYPCRWVGERSEEIMKKRLKLIESSSFKRVCEKFNNKGGEIIKIKLMCLHEGMR
jgi:hypothetical protein